MPKLHQLKNGNWIILTDISSVTAAPEWNPHGSVLLPPRCTVFLDEGRRQESCGFETTAEAEAYRDELAALVNMANLDVTDTSQFSTVQFHVEGSDYGNCVDIACKGDDLRMPIARISKDHLPGLVEALGGFVLPDGDYVPERRIQGGDTKTSGRAE